MPTISYPGRNPLAGDHRGTHEFLAKIQPLTGEGGALTRGLHDAFGSGDHAVQLLTVTASAQGKVAYVASRGR
jgi:hypothetical protein